VSGLAFAGFSELLKSGIHEPVRRMAEYDFFRNSACLSVVLLFMSR